MQQVCHIWQIMQQVVHFPAKTTKVTTFFSEIATLSHKFSLVTLYRNKTVKYSARINAIVACQMEFQLYPMDIQICPIYIESCEWARMWKIQLYNDQTMVHKFHVYSIKCYFTSPKRNFVELDKKNLSCLKNPTVIYKKSI